MMGIAAGRSLEGQNAARLAMTWKDRQRTRVPLVDLDDNPFCVERRTNEEWHMMQLNKVCRTQPYLRATGCMSDVKPKSSFFCKCTAQQDSKAHRQ